MKKRLLLCVSLASIVLAPGETPATPSIPSQQTPATLIPAETTPVSLQPTNSIKNYIIAIGALNLTQWIPNPTTHKYTVFAIIIVLFGINGLTYWINNANFTWICRVSSILWSWCYIYALYNDEVNKPLALRGINGLIDEKTFTKNHKAIKWTVLIAHVIFLIPTIFNVIFPATASQTVLAKIPIICQFAQSEAVSGMRTVGNISEKLYGALTGYHLLALDPFLMVMILMLRICQCALLCNIPLKIF